MFTVRRYCLTLLILLTLMVLPTHATVVRLITNVGLIDIQLYDTQAPLTVSNFLNYVSRDDYDNSFIHRSAPDFVIQGGGYRIDTSTGGIQTIITDPPVINEYDPARPNVRGTIAMAKQAGDPDSATSQWFFNLKDNSNSLGASNNGGFTVFGEVVGRGMELVDAIASLTIVAFGSPLDNLPLLGEPEDGTIKISQLVRIAQAEVLPTTTAPDVDRLFNYLEQQYPEYIAPAGGATGTADGYQYRYYPGTNSYGGVKDGRVYYLGPLSDNQILDIGVFDDWFDQAVEAGY